MSRFPLGSIRNGRTMRLRLLAVVAAGATACLALTAIGATPAAAAPAPPANVTAVPIDASTIVVSWTDNSGGTAKFVVSNGQTVSADIPAGTTSLTWGGLAPGTYMCFTVAAKDSTGQSAWTPYACATIPYVPSTPTNVTATATDSATIHVSWADNSGSTAKFVVSNSHVSSADLPAGTTSYDWSGLPPGTNMCFTVAAKNTSGQSPWSAYTCATTTARSCQATLQQADSSGNITFYHGTAEVYAKDIAANGIDLGKGSGNTDFGGGFYVTTNLNQAEEWAWKNFWDQVPTVLEYKVPAADLNPGVLCGHVFSSADSSWSAFVRGMRTSQPSTGGAGYDFVEGPLLLNPRQYLAGAAPIWGGQQDSIHDQVSVNIFDNGLINTFPAPTLVHQTIRSVANGMYVSAELGYTGSNYAMLRARASTQGHWETYSGYHYNTDNKIGFYNTANNYWVSAELGYAGGNYAMLRARASTQGPWEDFTIIENSDGTYALQSQANSLYVSAELGYTGGNYAMLRARSSTIGPWETFTDDSPSVDCICE